MVLLMKQQQKSFEYKTKIIGRTLANKSLDLPLINCKIEINLSWPKDCVISEIIRTPEVPAGPAANPSTDLVRPTQTTEATFEINDCKPYAPVVTFSINDNIKFLENQKLRFKKKISWNKYRFETTTQLKNNNLDCMIDLTFKISTDYSFMQKS